MTIRQWLKEAENALTAAGITSAKIDAELILAHAIVRDRTFFVTHPEEELPAEKILLADTDIKRRVNHEPMAFILGSREFYGLKFKTDKRALIPRGETEILVSTAIAWLEKHDTPQTVAEIGTGSGAIIVALAKNQPNHAFLATDISPEAVSLAQENAELNGIQTISFFIGSLANPLLPTYKGKVNCLVANLPYIPSRLLITLDPTITYYEPDIALDGGNDGLELYRLFFPEAKELLAPDGLLLFEHDYDQGEAMRKLAQDDFPQAKIKTLKDYLGDDRVLFCQT